MADSELQGLPAFVSPLAPTDLLIVNQDNETTPESRKMSAQELADELVSEFGIGSGGGGSVDGWTAVTDTWTYASASTINIPSDGTTVYKKYMKIRFKQGGGYKYYNACTIAATLLTVVVNNDYTVANSAITDIAYSFQDNPYGFPAEFAYTPASRTNTTVGDAAINLAHYTIIGSALVIRDALDWGSTTEITGTGIGVALPTGLASSANYQITNHMVGIIRMSVAGTAYQGTCVIGAGATVLSYSVVNASGTYATNSSITSTVPNTWSSSSDHEAHAVIMLG